MNDRIRFVEKFATANGDQPRIARPRTDEIRDPAPGAALRPAW
jgi:hypothetical protein